MELRFDKVCKNYDGIDALKDLSLVISEPGIYGLVGSNGAGKTTTIKLILNQIDRTSGSITFNGVDVQKLKQTQNPFSYIPDEPVYYEELTVLEHFRFISSMYKSQDKVGQLIKTLELDTHLKKMPDALSKGTRQKLSIGCALLRRFDILLADEPFTGLDPGQIMAFKQMLEKLEQQGKIIILSTHLLRMIDNECKKLIVLHDGKLKGFGTLAELKEKAGLTTNQSIDDVYAALTGEQIIDDSDEADGDGDDESDDKILDYK